MAGKPPSAGELLGVALAGELLLVLLALVWARYRGLPLNVGAGPWIRDVGAGVLAATAFAVVNYWLLCYAPALRAVRAVRRVYRDLLRPLFAEIGALEVVVISLAAGIGEELFFRGALQPEVGLIPASLVFGLLHTGTRGTIAFGGWAAVMGAAAGRGYRRALGWLAVATERAAARRSSRTRSTTRRRSSTSAGATTAGRLRSPPAGREASVMERGGCPGTPRPRGVPGR